MTPRWLPDEYDGSRTPAEAINDLRTIAAGGARSEAHVVLDPARGEVVGGSGPLSLAERAGTAVVIVEVAGTRVAEIDSGDILASRLRTYDGADYYMLVIETEVGSLHVSDAYND